MKRTLYLTLLLIFLSIPILSGQMVTRQAGLRLGYSSGIFYQVTQHAGTAEIGYNGMLSFKQSGLQLTGLKILYQNSLNDISRNLFLSWGYGGHIGFNYSDHVRFLGEDYYYSHDRFIPLFGVDGWLAAEYRIQDIPLNVSLNWKPFVEMTLPGFVSVIPWDFALSVSYIF